MRNAITLAALLSLRDLTDVRIIEALRAAGRAASGMFAALGATIPATVEIEGASRDVGPRSPDENTDPLTWRRGFFAAACAGDSASLERLSSTDFEAIRRAGDADEFSQAQIAALAAFGRKDPAAPQLLATALDAANPDTVAAAQRGFVLDVVAFEVELFFRLAEADAAGFNATLAKALVGHKHYYSKGDPSRTPIGQLALGPLAAACLANDRGIEVTVESDYLPRAVIEYPRARG